LAKATANNLAMPEGTFYQELQALAITVTAKAFKEILVTESKDWRKLIIDQINNVHRLEDEASCLHQNLEEESQGLESSQDHVSRESIACGSGSADSNAALESAFFRQRRQIMTKATIDARMKQDGLYKRGKIRVQVILN